MASFGVLGPLLVTDSEGRSVRLRGERQRSLLAMLLAHPGSTVPVDQLVEALWPEQPPPKSYASNLHTYVSRLRERLAVPIEHGAGGYLLAAESDLVRFETEVAEGRRAARAGEHASAAAHLRTALNQWRGPALADVRVPLLAPVAARLDAERLTVFEDRAEAELAAGVPGELVAELESFLLANPLRERAAALLMLALRRAGRQADALAVYGRTRAALLDELGVDPGAELRRAHEAVLRGEETHPVQATPVWPICQLPPDLADFAGREDEVDAVAAAVTGAPGAVPVTVLSGEPGAGKSTLAVRVAHRVRKEFPDGQLFVQLSGSSEPRDPADVLADLLRALGVTGPAIPDDPHARAAAYRGRLTDRRVLVVLDDAASVEQVLPLLPGTPGSAVLVTGRRRLSALDGAHRVPLGPLSDAQAVALLARIVGSARVDGEPGAAARIAAACGNLPLALRIAGTRLAIRPNLRLATLADRLDDERNRLDELAVSDRQVRTSIALSFHALSPLARAGVRALALCGDISAPAWAIAVLIDDPGADGAVEELIEASLLAPIGTDPTGEPRYRLHDLVRVFAREQGGPSPGIRTLVHAAVGLAEAAGQQLPWTVPLPRWPDDVPDQSLARDTVARLVDDPHTWFATEQANLVTVVGSIFRIGWHREAVLLLERLTGYLWLHGQYADLRACHENLRQLAQLAGQPRVAAWAEANLAVVVHARGEHEEAERRYRACAGALTGLGDRRSAAWVTANLARCLIGLGRPGESLEVADEALALLDGEPDETALRHVERIRTEALNRLGRPGDSVRVNRRTLAAARRSGDPAAIALALSDLAWSLTLAGEPAAAREPAEESVALLRQLPTRSALARCLRTLGAINAGLGRRDAAVAAYTEAHDLARALNERPRELSCARAIAASLIGEGLAHEAVPLLRAGLAEFRSMGSVASTVISLRVLATAYEAVGEDARAREARAEADRLGDPRDASAATLVGLLLELTRDAGRALTGSPHTPGVTPSQCP